MRRRFALLIALASGLSACTGPTPYATPVFPFHPGYRGAPAGAPVLLVNTDWWQSLKDPTLNALMKQALADSPSLALARERVIQAQAQAKAVPTALNGGGAARAGGIGGGEEVYEANLQFAWLLDPFGGRRAQQEAALGRVQVAEAEASAARLLLLDQLGRAYVDLRYYQRLLTLRQEDLSRRRQTLEMSTQLFGANDATRIDLLRAEAQVTEIEALIPGLKASVQGQKNRIAVLAGVQPGELAIDLDSRSAQPRPRLSPQVGIPADLLRNRPDIRVAERSYYAAVADMGAARAELYPKLSLVGTVALAGTMGNGGAEYFFGPSLGLPDLPGNVQKGTYDARASQVRQAQLAWKSAVLDAILEVEGALADYSAATTAMRSADQTVSLRRETLDLTRTLVDQDGATLSDLIDAEEDIANAEGARADTLRSLGMNYVALNVALGSGSSLPPVAPVQ